MPDNTWVVLYTGGEFKISPGSGNIQGIVIKKAVGFVISPGIKVSVVRRSTLDITSVLPSESLKLENLGSSKT